MNRHSCPSFAAFQSFPELSSGFPAAFQRAVWKGSVRAFQAFQQAPAWKAWKARSAWSLGPKRGAFQAFQQLFGVGKLESQKKVNDFNLSSFPSFPPPKGGKKGGWKARPSPPLGAAKTLERERGV
jgi:hypothetical protein